jgi:hypothetical protein
LPRVEGKKEGECLVDIEFSFETMKKVLEKELVMAQCECT